MTARTRWTRAWGTRAPGTRRTPRCSPASRPRPRQPRTASTHTTAAPGSRSPGQACRPVCRPGPCPSRERSKGSRSGTSNAAYGTVCAYALHWTVLGARGIVSAECCAECAMSVLCGLQFAGLLIVDIVVDCKCLLWCVCIVSACASTIYRSIL